MLSKEQLDAALRYDRDSGVFNWTGPRGRMPAGEIAGVTLSTGYIAVRLLGKRYLAHRLAWLTLTGNWPVGEIDHIDGNVANNRPNNLRDVPRALNQQNQRKAQIDNKNGFLGVSSADAKRGFRARIFVNGKEKHLGTFSTPEAAHEAYLSAKRDLHPGGTI